MVNNHSERLHIKEKDDTHKFHKKLSEHNSKNKYEYEKEKDEVDENSEIVIGVFINNKLQIIDSNCNFQDVHQEVECRIVCNEKIKQAIVTNEEIAVTDASIKDGNMAGV